MVGMTVDRPVGKHDVWRLGAQHGHKALGRGGRDLGGTIDLAREFRRCTENAARALGFAGPDPRRVLERAPRDPAFAAREVDDRYAMSVSGVACQRAPAPRLGIVGMAADTHDVQRSACGRLP